MLLPDKYIPVEDTLPYMAKEIYKRLQAETLPFALWAKVRKLDSVATYERFVYALDFMYAIGIIEMTDEGFIRKVQQC